MTFAFIIRLFLNLLAITVLILILLSIIENFKIKPTGPIKMLSDSEIIFIQNLLAQDDTKNRTTQKPVHKITAPDSVNCYFSKNDSVAELTERNVSKKSIFFLDTSCKFSESGNILIEPIQACAIESAALANVNYSVNVLYLSPGLIKDSGTLSDKLLKALGEYKNIKILHLDFEKLANSASMSYLYYNTWNSSYDNLRATIKFVLLKKHGGIYLDNDVLVLKTFETLPHNFIGTNSDGTFGSGVIGWRVRRNVTVPASANNTLGTMICNTATSKCDGFEVFNSKVFYPIGKDDWKVLHENNKNNENLYKIITNTSYTIKTYVSLAINSNILFNSETLYNRIAKKCCPKVFEKLNNALK